VSDQTTADFGKRSTSAATASGHELPDLASSPEQAEAVGPGAERHRDARHKVAATAEGCGRVANRGDARVASAGCAKSLSPDTRNYIASLVAERDEAQKQIESIRQAIRDYFLALDERQHGGLAQDKAFNAICTELGMSWRQGKERAARKALSAKEPT
jgi:hypothetical protein